MVINFSRFRRVVGRFWGGVFNLYRGGGGGRKRGILLIVLRVFYFIEFL